MLRCNPEDDRPGGCPTGLLERDLELAALTAAVERTVRGHGGVIALIGPAGIGKTVLLQALASLAAAAGVRVLRAHGGQYEDGLAYGMVHQLFGSVVRTDEQVRASVLQGVANLAAPALGLSAAPATHSPLDQRTAALHGLYWLVADMAERLPLLLAVDDAHWADEPSLEVLHHLSRRLADLPVLLAVTSRDLPAATRDRLRALLAHSGAEVLRPAPLSPAGIAHLALNRIGVEPDTSFLRAFLAATGGNPFLVHALLASVPAQDRAPDAGIAERLASRPPANVVSAVHHRLTDLSRDARALAEAVAVLQEASTASAADVAGVPPTRAALAVDELVIAAVLVGDEPLRFVHPLVREALVAGLPAGRRSVLHDRAALVLDRAGAAPARVADHLLAGQGRPTRWGTTALRRAAAEASAAGVPEAAVRLLVFAVTHADDADLDLLVQLARAQVAAGDPQAVDTFTKVRDRAEDPQLRAEAAVQLARAAGMSGNYRTVAVLLQQDVDTDRIDPDLALQVEAEIVGAVRLLPDSRAWAESRLEAWSQDPPTPSPASVVALANAALYDLERNRPRAEVAVLAQQALQGGWLWERHTFQYSYAANVLTWTDHFAEAAAAWDAGLQVVGEQGRPVMAALAHGWRSFLRMRTGDVRGAESDARAAAEIIAAFDGYDWAPAKPYIDAHLADVMLERHVDDAGPLVDHDGEWERLVAFFLDSRARWRLASGDAAAAHDDFLLAGEALGTRGGRDTPCILPWRSGAAAALVQLGEPAQAERLAREELALAELVGAPRSLGVALRTVAAATPDLAARLVLLEQAVAVLLPSGAQLEAARAQLDLGACLRRLRRPSEARPPLREALDAAVRCGSILLEEQVRHELAAAGARPRRTALTGPEALTASERRVAEMAAAGRTNRQIAQALFVSTRTVASHLGSAYRKLGVAGRDHLAAMLGGAQSSS